METPLLTIAYSTNRREPRWKWFLDSLRRETGGNYDGIKVVVVDFFQEDRPHSLPSYVTHVTPKPTVWQGKHRLTSKDYFAASNARNTALCLAPDGYIAHVDDLSVLMPGWLGAVREAIKGNYVVLGAYKKVLGLQVDDNGMAAWKEFQSGIDSRWNAGSKYRAVKASGRWLFGCSVAGPVEAFLSINGWDEDADSMGGEDYLCGIMLERAGWQIMYDRRMLTLESEEDHHVERPFVRIIKHQPCDASVKLLNHVLHQGRDKAPNYFGLEGIRPLRNRVLAGEPFPITTIPEHHWPDGQPLREM